MQENEERRQPVVRPGGSRSVAAVVTVVRDGVTWLARLKIEGVTEPVFFSVSGVDEEQALANAVQALRAGARATFEDERPAGRRALAAGAGWLPNGQPALTPEQEAALATWAAGSRMEIVEDDC